MMSLDNAMTQDELAAWGQRVVAGARRRDGALRVRAEDRRRGDERPVRGRPLRPGRDPRRRAGRRGRHGERGDDQRGPRAPAGAEGHRGAGRAGGTGRGLPAGGQLRADERGRRGQRGAALRQPAQRRRRQPAPEGPLDHRQARPLVLGVPARRGGRRSAARAAHRRARLSRQARRPGQPRDQGVRQPRRRPRPLRALGGPPPRPRLRDRRRGGQGRRRRPADPARIDVAGAAVGDRLQVPARGAHDDAARHPGVDRPHRPGHTVRDARAGVRRRLDGGRRHLAQRGSGARQGRPARRHRDRAQGGRRDPRGRRPGARDAAGGLEAVDVPDDLPVPAAEHARPARRGGRHPLRRAGVPVPARPAGDLLRVARGDGHRGPGRAHRVPAHRRRTGRRSRRRVRADEPSSSSRWKGSPR